MSRLSTGAMMRPSISSSHGSINHIKIEDDEKKSSGSDGYAILAGIFAALGGLFFGFDQGVTGGILVMDSFLNSFCIGYHGTDKECHSTELPHSFNIFVTLFNIIYYIGCIFGAMGSNYLADRFGRRLAIFMAGVFFCVGTVWVVVTPNGLEWCVLMGRFVAGLGVGSSSFILPIYGAEVAPARHRGLLSGFMQMTVTTGLLTAGLVNYAVQNNASGWRISLAVAISAPLIVMLGIYCVPESPRWLYATKGEEAARATLVKLRQTEDVNDELESIGQQLHEEDYGKSTFADCFTPEVRRRTIIAMMLQVLQQATGINPMFTYGGLIFQSVLPNGGILSLLALQIVNWIGTIPAMYGIDKWGRRTLLLLGAAGMVIGHVVSATIYTAECHKTADGQVSCKGSSGYLMLAFSAFFIFNFAISWGPICWVYPAELFSMRVRAKAVALSTAMNWCMGMIMMAVQLLFPLLGINGVFFLFAALCTLAGLFVFKLCPETKGLMLEEVELLFKSK